MLWSCWLLRRNGRLAVSITGRVSDVHRWRPTMPSYTLTAVFLAGRRMTVIAQQKPDFSGEWKLNRQASTLSPIVAPAAQSGVLRIEHHEPRFTCSSSQSCSTVSRSSRNSSFCRMVVKLPRRMTGGRRIVSTLRWDGDALVATWRIQGPGGEVTISFRYELQDGGRRLRAAEQIRGGGRDQDNLWVFERP